MENKDQFINTMEEKISSINNKVDEYQKELKKLPNISDEKFETISSQMNEKKDLLNKKINRAKVTGELAWDEAKSGVETAFNDLKTTFESVRSTL